MNKTNTGIETLNSYQKITVLLIYQKITLLSFSYCNLKNKPFTTEESGHVLICLLPWYEAWPKTAKWGKSLFHLTGCSPSSREAKKGTRGRRLKQNHGRRCLEACFSTATFHTTPADLTMKVLHTVSLALLPQWVIKTIPFTHIMVNVIKAFLQYGICSAQSILGWSQVDSWRQLGWLSSFKWHSTHNNNKRKISWEDLS